MKKITPPRSGKLFVHNHGTGIMGPADVRQRAEENALIEGHAAPTGDDYAEARRELRGDRLPPTADSEADSRRRVSRDPSDPPGDPGREKPNQEAADEQKATERLVLEGVEEAQHEQMLAARRRKNQG